MFLEKRSRGGKNGDVYRATVLRNFMRSQSIYISYLENAEYFTRKGFSISVSTGSKLTFVDAAQNFIENYGNSKAHRERTRFISMRLEILTWILLILHFGWALRYVLFTFTDSHNPINLYLGDANFMLESGRRPINIVYGAMNLSGAMTNAYMKFSPILFPSRHLDWIKISRVLETHNYRGIGPFNSQVRLVKILCYSQLIGVLVGIFFINVNFFAWTPREYWTWGFVMTIYHMLGGFLTVAYAFNRGILYSLHLFVQAKFCEHLEETMNQNRNSQKIISQCVDQYLDLMDELIGAFRFHKPINGLCFAINFISQVIMLYYFLFSELETRYRFPLIFIGAVNNISSLSIAFLTSNYARNKLNKLLHRFYSVASSNGLAKESRFRLLRIIEHVWDKNEFKILGGLSYCSEHFILVQLETAALLLLIISNTNSFISPSK
ncbi:uncharacterized protein LOC141857845 [Brevipalpus obovatus]|uniref:uncharacterized protein LOC141857845 n=1 Tax=Brevipalpus obovatus TaxID=246614 RepID=UPI003D9DE975